jgi:hypothetical protein
MALPVKIAGCLGVLKYYRNRNSKSQISNIKQITMTEIPKFQTYFGYLVFDRVSLEYSISQRDWQLLLGSHRD